MHEDNPVTRIIYIAIAGLAGTITSLATMPWVNMTWRAIVLTIVVGMSFALFAAPVIATSVFRLDDSTIKMACFITYIGGTCANAVVPVVISRLKKFAEKYGISKETKQ